MSETEPLIEIRTNRESKFSLHTTYNIKKCIYLGTWHFVVNSQFFSVIPRKKWLLLIEFCCLAFLQGSIFLAWNPIANSVMFAFAPTFSASTFAWQVRIKDYLRI